MLWGVGFIGLQFGGIVGGGSRSRFGRQVVRMASGGEAVVHKSALDDVSSDGEFKRKASTFRSFISKDGEFQPAKGRYHLYVSYACPWAHRTLITRALKGLDEAIDVTVVDYFMGSLGWTFTEPEPLYGLEKIRDLYFKADKDYNGRFTVPVLWDKEKETIVNNESSEIIVMLNDEMNDFATHPEVDLYPEAKRGTVRKCSVAFDFCWSYATGCRTFFSRPHPLLFPSSIQRR